MGGDVKTRKRLTHRIDFRISAEKHQELSALVSRTRGTKTISELLRKILEEGKFTVETYDSTIDKVMEELSSVRRQLQAIGVNINQVTRRFHAEKTAESRLFQALEMIKLFQQADLRISEVIGIIAKMGEGWLRK